MNKRVFFLFFAFIFTPVFLSASSWDNWELGGELGLALGSGGEEGRILSPGTVFTITKTDVSPIMEFGLAYYFGSEISNNYSSEDVADYNLGAEREPEIVADADKEIRRRMSVVPLTFNFIYTVHDNFYIGGGIGLYNVWYRKEPLGDWRAYPDPTIEKGAMYSHSPTTTLGFQQMVGVEIFPVSENWNWFVGARSFMTSQTAAGRILGITIGAKVRYSW